MNYNKETNSIGTWSVETNSWNFREVSDDLNIDGYLKKI
jgi:hypothetical protein